MQRTLSIIVSNKAQLKGGPCAHEAIQGVLWLACQANTLLHLDYQLCKHIRLVRLKIIKLLVRAGTA